MILNSLDNLFTTPSLGASSSLYQMMGTSTGDFTSVFESLLSASRSHTLPSNDQRLALVTAQSKLQQQNTLFNIFSGAYSTKSYGYGMLGGLSGMTSLPSWAYDVQRVMGDDRLDGLLGLQKQMAAYTSNLLNQVPSSSFSSMF